MQNLRRVLMNKKIRKITFNGNKYDILNEIIFDNIHYFLIYNGDRYKIVYKIDNDYFQLIKHDNYKDIISQLYASADEYKLDT